MQGEPSPWLAAEIEGVERGVSRGELACDERLLPLDARARAPRWCDRRQRRRGGGGPGGRGGRRPVGVTVDVGVGPVAWTVGVGEAVGVGQLRARQSLWQQTPSAPAPGSHGSPGWRTPSPQTGHAGNGESAGMATVTTTCGLKTTPGPIATVVLGARTRRVLLFAAEEARWCRS
jgi:hypothetical protein